MPQQSHAVACESTLAWPLARPSTPFEQAAARRAARPAWHSPAPAEAEPSADAELSEASAEPAEPRAASPATAEVEPHVDAEPSAEVPPAKDAPHAEDTFDWKATPGPAKFAAFMEAFPPNKYGGPAYVPAYPLQKK